MIFAALRRLSLIAGLVASLAVPVCAQGIVGPASGGGAADKPAWVLKGAQIDCDFAGGRYYNCMPDVMLNNTRSGGGMAQQSDSTFRVFTASNELKITDVGLTVDGATTNLALWSRDLTQTLTWPAVNITTALNGTGIDGTVNSATRLTAGAANGTITQALVVASGQYQFSAYFKRVTGSGNISITNDNFGGATICSGINTTTWTRCVRQSAAAQTALTIGIKLATSGDVILVDATQTELSIPGNGFSTAATPVFTTTASATRNADVTTLNGSLNSALSGSNKTMSLFQQVGGYIQANNGYFVLCGGAGREMAGSTDSNLFNWNNSTTTRVNSIFGATLGSLSCNNSKRIDSLTTAVTNQAMSAANNGTAAFGTTSLGANTSFGVGQVSGGGSYGYLTVMRIATWPYQLDGQTASTMTCMSGVC